MVRLNWVINGILTVIQLERKRRYCTMILLNTLEESENMDYRG